MDFTILAAKINLNIFEFWTVWGTFSRCFLTKGPIKKVISRQGDQLPVAALIRGSWTARADDAHWLFSCVVADVHLKYIGRTEPGTIIKIIWPYRLERLDMVQKSHNCDMIHCNVLQSCFLTSGHENILALWFDYCTLPRCNFNNNCDLIVQLRYLVLLLAATEDSLEQKDFGGCFYSGYFFLHISIPTSEYWRKLKCRYCLKRFSCIIIPVVLFSVA